MSLIDCTPRRTPGGRLRSNEALEYYACNGGQYEFAESGHVLSPWVAIDFVDSDLSGSAGAAITVGNKSSGSTNPENCAVIKSFSLGHSDGFDVRVTIHDTQGGSFEQFMNHILQDWLCLKDRNPATLMMKIQFGWTKNGCYGPLPRASSPCYYVICDSVDVNYSEGKFIFDIVGKDTPSRMLEGALELQQGGEGENAMHLMHAMYKLMSDSSPPNIALVTYKIMKDGVVVQAGYNPSSTNVDDAPEIFTGRDAMERKFGPKGKWDAKNQDKLHAARRWMSECLSINGLPWFARYNPEVLGGELVFWESKKPECAPQNDQFWDQLCLGTYIVNGGPASPVIEFNPKIRWDFGLVTGSGGAMGDLKAKALEPEGSKNPGHPCLPKEKVEGAGGAQQTTTSETQQDRLGQNSDKEVADSEIKDKKATQISYTNGISADLVIVGDPTFCPPIEAINIKTISIIVINPFYIMRNNGSACGDWLSLPPVNGVLSNKAWIIKSINHTIEAGKYTTTIGVELTVPGVDYPSGNPWGGWIGGFRARSCS